MVDFHLNKDQEEKLKKEGKLEITNSSKFQIWKKGNRFCVLTTDKNGQKHYITPKSDLWRECKKAIGKNPLVMEFEKAYKIRGDRSVLPKDDNPKDTGLSSILFDSFSSNNNKFPALGNIFLICILLFVVIFILGMLGVF